MSLIPFYFVEPELAIEETRVIHLLAPYKGVPPGDYSMLEFYCPDPDCDCRRVMLNAVEGERINRFLASISYGFDQDDKRDWERDMQGPFLDALNPQSEYAEALLELVEKMLLNDPRYVARLERHYALTKRAASDPTHPLYDKLQEIVKEESEILPDPQPVSRTKRVGRNDPCPCGSGKKYKYCCMRKDRRSR